MNKYSNIFIIFLILTVMHSCSATSTAKREKGPDGTTGRNIEVNPDGDQCGKILPNDQNVKFSITAEAQLKDLFKSKAATEKISEIVRDNTPEGRDCALLLYQICRICVATIADSKECLGTALKIIDKCKALNPASEMLDNKQISNHVKECASTIPYDGKFISLREAYDLVSIKSDGIHNRSLSDTEENTILTYYNRAMFICEEYQKGHLSKEEYSNKRKNMEASFTDTIEMIKRDNNVQELNSFDWKIVRQLSSDLQIEFKHLADKDNNFIPSKYNELFMSATSNVKASGPTIDIIFACILNAITNIASQRGTQVIGFISGPEAKNKMSGSQQKASMYWKTKEELKVAKYLIYVDDGDKNDEVLKFKECNEIYLPHSLTHIAYMKYCIEYINNGDVNYRYDGWEEQPNITYNDIKKILNALKKYGIKTTQMIAYTSSLQCKVFLDLEDAKAAGLQDVH